MPGETSGNRLEERPEATLACFVLDRKKISNGQANHRVFLPPPDRELSTFNIDDLGADSIWAIAETVRSEQGKEKVFGRADIRAESVYEIGLTPIRDDKPLRHVIIVGWPEDKGDQIHRAQELAARARFQAR